MSEQLQCDVRMERRLGAGYAIPARSLKPLCANGRPSATFLNDGGSAYHSNLQGKIIEELVVSRPDLVELWATFYAPQEAPLIYLCEENRVQVNSLFRAVGSHPQADRNSPIHYYHRQ
jgi:hypothetical protein